jgi:hypothetical protein
LRDVNIFGILAFSTLASSMAVQCTRIFHGCQAFSHIPNSNIQYSFAVLAFSVLSFSRNINGFFLSEQVSKGEIKKIMYLRNFAVNNGGVRTLFLSLLYVQLEVIKGVIFVCR